MSKPPHKAKEEENLSSGSDTESESDEDEDTVSRYLNYSLLVMIKNQINIDCLKLI